MAGGYGVLGVAILENANIMMLNLRQATRHSLNLEVDMLAPIAALFLALGAVNTPEMVEAEVEKAPTIEVDSIQTAQADLDSTQGGELGW
jgi:hypothetical protein